MFGHGGEYALDVEGEKTLADFSVDGFEPGTNTVYQFYSCHCHGYSWKKIWTKGKRWDTRQIDRLIANHGYTSVDLGIWKTNIEKSMVSEECTIFTYNCIVLKIY